MPAESTLPRRVRRLLSLAAAGATCAALGLAAAVVPFDRPVADATVAAVASETTDGVRLSVAPADGTDVAAGEPLGVVVEIVNGTDAAVRAGTLKVGVATFQS